MSNIKFNYLNTYTIIQANSGEKMKDIIKKFFVKIDRIYISFMMEIK